MYRYDIINSYDGLLAKYIVITNTPVVYTLDDIIIYTIVISSFSVDPLVVDKRYRFATSFMY